MVARDMIGNLASFKIAMFPSPREHGHARLTNESVALLPEFALWGIVDAPVQPAAERNIKR